MDIIDNVIFASNINRPSFFPPIPTPIIGNNPSGITSEYGPPLVVSNPVNVGLISDPVYTYIGTSPTLGSEKFQFCSLADFSNIERAIKFHWFDIVNRVLYKDGGINLGTILYSDFSKNYEYHLIYAYLIENTKILDIFAKVLEIYFNSEDFGTTDNELAFNWLTNSEALFYKNDTLGTSTISSFIRSNPNSIRRNAYWRMFGMDLSFSQSSSESSLYFKSKQANSEFVVIFEKYLSEFWQAYANANNSSGVNSSDYSVLEDLALQLKELLAARRGSTTLPFRASTLSKEEYYSVLITSWFLFAISYDSPIVKFLKCQSTTAGERLLKIGSKVGIPCHQKSQTLFEMASAASNILRKIENGGLLDNITDIRDIVRAQIISTTDVKTNVLTDLLTLINNWEKATGHRIKNVDNRVSGVVNARQNGSVPKPVMN